MNGKRQKVEKVVTWSELPGELLNKILTKLRLNDYLNFRLVCATWREAVKQQLSECKDPTLLMLPYCIDEQMHYSFVCPFNDRWYQINKFKFDIEYKCLGSFHGWLLMINVYSLDTIFFINPFTGVQINLPQWDRTNDIYKVAFSSAPTNPKCCTVVIPDTSSRTSFKFCRVGDEEWTEVESDSSKLKDALFCRGKLYLLCSEKPRSSTRSTAAVANTTTHLKLEYLGLPDRLSYYDPCLVESEGEILLVEKSPDTIYGLECTIQTYKFIVFKLDLSASSWAKMKKIDNRVLFMGRCSSVSFSATELGCRENQIYFVDPNLNIGCIEYLTYFREPKLINTCWCVFNMEDGSCKRGSTSSNPLLDSVSINGDPMWITPSFV